MKIAIPTEDKVTISEHFGGAPFFVVATVESDKVLGKEIREKPGHEKYAATEIGPQLNEKGIHGFGSLAAKRHDEIRKVIKDCNAAIVGRIGLGAYQDLIVSGLKVTVTDVKEIDEALSLYLQEKLPSLEERIC